MAAGRIIRGRDLVGAQTLSVDAVIVGSGASGAVVAAELAAAGQRVVVLEEGPHVTGPEHGRMRPSESIRSLWREGAMTAALGLGDTPLINVTMGRGVGGSSMLTGGVCFRTPGHVLHRWYHERRLTELTEQSLEPYFEDVERISNVELVPESMRSKSTVLWGVGAQKLGATLRPNRRNTRGCDGCSQCNFGCPKGAKMSVDLTFLPRAIQAGCEVLSDCLVDRLIIEGGRAVGVRGRLLNRPGLKPGDRVEVRAARVILAAGAAHTPLLLLRSGVGKRGGQVGRNMTLHPSFRMIARFDERVDGWKGALQSAHSDSYEHEGLTMMSVFVPPAVVLSAVPGFGPAFTERAAGLPHLAMFGGMIHDEGGGRIRRGPGREPIMTYRMDRQDRARLPQLIRRLGEAFIAAGARELYAPVLGSPPMTPDVFRSFEFERVPGRRFECTSQHPLGTTRMGDRFDNSVVDTWGRTWDVDNLYIVDGGVIPTSLGVNPQLSIMAMALRLARGILEPRPRS